MGLFSSKKSTTTQLAASNTSYIENSPTNLNEITVNNSSTLIGNDGIGIFINGMKDIFGGALGLAGNSVGSGIKSAGANVGVGVMVGLGVVGIAIMRADK